MSRYIYVCQHDCKRVTETETLIEFGYFCGCTGRLTQMKLSHIEPDSTKQHKHLSKEAIRAKFQRLWTKAVGTTDYDKLEWMEFDLILETLVRNM